jgi:phage terminase small subunit
MPVLKNAKHERFAAAIVKGKSIAEAYEIAGFAPHKTNPHRLRNNETVSARISELLERIEERTIVSVERIVKENARIAFADITDVMSFSGKTVLLKSSADLPPDVTAAISEVRKTKDGIMVKFHDKGRALDALARHKGMFRENINLNVTVSLADLVNMSYRDDLPAPMKQIEGKVDAGE